MLDILRAAGSMRNLVARATVLGQELLTSLACCSAAALVPFTSFAWSLEERQLVEGLGSFSSSALKNGEVAVGEEPPVPGLVEDPGRPEELHPPVQRHSPRLGVEGGPTLLDQGLVDVRVMAPGPPPQVPEHALLELPEEWMLGPTIVEQ
eukprot:10210256-Lingulodinium_polyedra.AAC.1